MSLQPEIDICRSVFHVLVILTIFLQKALAQCAGTTVVYTAADTYQVFTSINYPFNYDNNQNCAWRIEADNVTDAIRMEITDAGIEYHADCVYDYGEVFDGYNVSADSMGKFCGTNNPSYVSNGNYMTVTFHSDYSLSSKGFKARYKSGPRESLIDVEQDHKQVNTVAILGASIGGLVFVAIFITLVYTYIQAKKAKELRRNPMRRSLGPVRVEPFGYGGGWNYLDGPAPPAYGEIYSSPMSPPPQYSEVDPNPNPGAPLPGRSEFMPENGTSDRQITNGVEQRPMGRTDTNANTHFVVTNSLRGLVTQINNYTSRGRSRCNNSAGTARGNTVQSLNQTSFQARNPVREALTTNSSDTSLPSNANSLPNATAPISTEPTQRPSVDRNNTSDSRSRANITVPSGTIPSDTVSNGMRENNSDTVTNASQTVADEVDSPNCQNLQDRENTSSTISEISLPSTRSVTMISDAPAQGPTHISS